MATDGNANRYGVVGGVYSDDSVGLQYMQHRWYSPTLGRFMSRDPLGMRGGVNLYEYAGNNPLGFYDPIGLGQIVAGGFNAMYDGYMVNSGGSRGTSSAPFMYMSAQQYLTFYGALGAATAFRNLPSRMRQTPVVI